MPCVYYFLEDIKQNVQSNITLKTGTETRRRILKQNKNAKRSSYNSKLALHTSDTFATGLAKVVLIHTQACASKIQNKCVPDSEARVTLDIRFCFGQLFFTF